MKRNFLLKSGFCMLLAVGALTPLASIANEQGKMDSGRKTFTQGETPTVYGNPSEDSAKNERGAKGPMGSSRMEPAPAPHFIYGETPTQYGGDLWEGSEKMGHGAQGPIRNDRMDDSGTRAFYGERPTEYGK